jgi:hypothetical protein
MAIDRGLAIGCTDLQRTGGISHICLRTIVDGDIVTYDSTADTHAISNIQKAGPADADWDVFEFKNETPVMSIAATKENGSTTFECTLSFYLPNMNSSKFEALQTLLDTCMMGIVVDTNGNEYVLGVSQKYDNDANGPFRNQTYLNLSGMEGSTGAAYSEENGITVTLMARQFELPRLYSGTLTIANDLTATTGA